jgi:hypothetical protein
MLLPIKVAPYLALEQDIIYVGLTVGSKLSKRYFKVVWTQLYDFVRDFKRKLYVAKLTPLINSHA